MADKVKITTDFEALAPEALRAHREKMAVLRQERETLLRKASNFEKVDRIPHLSFFVTWKYIDAGYKLMEALLDLDIIEECNVRFQEKYQFDGFIENGTRNAYRVPMAMGESAYTFDDESDAVYIKDQEFISQDEVKQLAANPKKFMYEVMFPRRYPKFNKSFDKKYLQESYDEMIAGFGVGARVDKRLEEDYGMPRFSKYGSPANPVDTYVNYIRGIKGLAIDMRRNKEAFRDVLNALGETFYQPSYENIKRQPDGPVAGYSFDGRGALLMHNFLSKKQFEEYYWPFAKKTLDLFVSKNMNVRYFIEGTGAHIWDFLQDYPKGKIILALDSDDVLEVRKKLPNCPIMGGTTLTMLGNSTPEECVNQARTIIDGLNGEGFILSQDKMGSYPGDAKSENLQAVCDFVREYKL